MEHIKYVHILNTHIYTCFVLILRNVQRTFSVLEIKFDNTIIKSYQQSNLMKILNFKE